LRTKFKLSLDANLTLHKSSGAKLLKYLLWKKKSSREGSQAKVPLLGGGTWWKLPPALNGLPIVRHLQGNALI
jgi:hypothetical protein